MPEAQDHKQRDSPRYVALLTLGALGVVYGDIGTSPLYALRECFFGEYGIGPSRENVLGVLSLVFWALILAHSLSLPSMMVQGAERVLVFLSMSIRASS